MYSIQSILYTSLIGMIQSFGFIVSAFSFKFINHSLILQLFDFLFNLYVHDYLPFVSYLDKPSFFAFLQQFHIFIPYIAWRLMINTHVIRYAKLFAYIIVKASLPVSCRPTYCKSHTLLSNLCFRHYLRKLILHTRFAARFMASASPLSTSLRSRSRYSA